MMHQIAQHLTDFECSFTPFYSDTMLRHLVRAGFLEFTILGGQFQHHTKTYLSDHKLPVDFGGTGGEYNLVLTCSDLIIQKNIRDKKVVLVQEGMTDPENFMYYLVKYLRLPRYLASTSTAGLSHNYDKFCVASEGYKEFFIKKGIDPQKLIVTGIPNFDDVKKYLNNDFPEKNYVLVATSDTRETFKFDNRKKLIKQALEIANGRKLIFKLHPNENYERNSREIRELSPDATIYHHANTNHLIANCDVLITQYSSVVYIGLALGKEVHSYFKIAQLKRMTPIQNGGTSAQNIAMVCRNFLDTGRDKNVKPLQERMSLTA
jgi:hypothetical protein